MFKKGLFLLLILPILSQCTDDGLSSKISFAIIPDDPIVFTSDITIPETGDKPDTVIAAPWMRFDFTIVNSSEKAFILQSLKLRYLNDNNIEIGSSTVDPSSFGDGTLPPETIFGVITAGKKFTLTTATNFETRAIVSGMPKQKGDDTIYKVKVEPVGWFGTETEPTDRFKRSYFFTTQ